MESDGKAKISYDVIKFILYAITLVVAVIISYGSLDKRITITETKLDQKVDLNQVMERIDKLELKIENKIDNEFRKLKDKN